MSTALHILHTLDNVSYKPREARIKISREVQSIYQGAIDFTVLVLYFSNPCSSRSSQRSAPLRAGRRLREVRVRERGQHAEDVGVEGRPVTVVGGLLHTLAGGAREAAPLAGLPSS